MPSTDAQTGYARLDDLNMYYEIHGSGRPLILLHGAYMTIDTMGPLLPGLARMRQVVAVEQQGHGRTADVDRPLTYEQMADDTAALLRHLQIDSADVFGYSMGGGIGLQLAIRHPALVRKLVLASVSFTSDGVHAVALDMFPSITPELFAGSPIEEAYLQTAPNPADFPKLVEKLKHLDTTPYAWPEQDIRAIAAPTLIVLGDSDGIRLEHAIELFGGYVLNTKPDFGYFGYVPEHDRSQLPLQAGRDRVAELTCIWMIRHGRPPLLRYKVYTQVVLDAFGTKATYILGSTNVERVRQIQQRVMKHDLWHGIDTNSKERWLYYAKRRELVVTFVSVLISDVIERGGNLPYTRPPRGQPSGSCAAAVKLSVELDGTRRYPYGVSVGPSRASTAADPRASVVNKHPNG